MNEYNKLFEAIKKNNVGKKITVSKDEIKKDLLDNGINEEDVDLIMKNYQEVNDILNKFYKKETEEKEKKVGTKKIKQKSIKFTVKKEEIEQYINKQKEKKEKEKEKINNIINTIKTELDNIEKSDFKKNIEDILNDEFREERKKGNKIGFKKYLLNTFYIKDGKTGKYSFNSDKLEEFIDEIEGREKAIAKKTETKEIPIKEGAVLSGLGLRITPNNYNRIANEDATIEINDDDCGYFYEVKASLLNEENNKPYNFGDILWLAEADTDKNFNFAFYILLKEFETNGLLNQHESIIDSIVDNINYDFSNEVEQDVAEFLEKAEQEEDEKYGTKYLAYAVQCKLVDDKTALQINKLDDEKYYRILDKMYDKFFDLLFDYRMNDVYENKYSKYLNKKYGTGWYGREEKIRQKINELIDFEKLSLDFLSIDKSRPNKIIDDFTTTGVKQFEYDDKTWYAAALDVEMLEQIGFFEE